MANLTPTEDLVMEVLSARARLGETMWTFNSCHKQTIRKLESRGLVNMIHGTVDKTVRASLTDDGRKEYMMSEYNAPVFKRYKLKKRFR